MLLAAFLAACATDGAGPGGRPGPATRLQFSAQPNAVTAGVPITPAIQVTARDVQGNTAVEFTGTVTVALSSNPGGATLTGTTAVAAVAGVATFTELSLNRSGPGYTLVATSGTLTAATSAAVTVSAAAAMELVVTGQPGNTAAGAAMTPAVQVTARDAFGNTATGFTGGVTVAIGMNPNGGVLTGTTPRPAVGGVATFPDLSIDKSGAGYTLAASANALIPDTSTTFTISAGSVSQSQSTMSASPTSITASNGSSTSTITVVAKDAFGNLIQGATVVLAASGTGNALTQPAAPTTVSGVATGTVSATAAETKTISATIAGVAITQTASVTVTPAAASRLEFTVQPSATGAGAAIAPPIQVEVRDQFGNRVTTATHSVGVSILNNPGSPAGTLSGTTPRTAVSGLVTFNDLSINRAGTGYTLLTTSTGLISDTSSAFNITAGGVSASQSTLSAAPAAIPVSSGASTSTITVTARDGFGNPVQGATVVLSATGTGNTLTQPVGTTSAMGVATGTLSSTAAGAKIVSAVISGVAINQTDTVTVSPTVAVSLHFTVEPTGATAGAAIAPAIQVTARDQFGNTATSHSASVTIAIGTNPAGGTLSGTATRAAVAGVATFSGLSIDKTGTYTLEASSLTLSVATSAVFTITAGGISAARSLVSAAPATITASTGSSVTTITVTARDAFDNPIQGVAVVLSSTGTNNSITQPGVTASSGVTTGTLSSTKSESKTVSATIAGLLVTQTAVVTVNPAGLSAPQSTMSASPSTIQASNGAIGSTITVTARDAFGNGIQGAGVVLISTGSGNTFSPAGPLTTGLGGVATTSFSSTVAEPKTVSATINGTPIPPGVAVTVIPGEVSAAQSTLQASPASIVASNGSSISTITVTARDDQGNPVPGASVALAATGPGNTLTQPVSATNVNGVATGTLRSTVAGAKVVSGTIGGTGIAQTDTVTVTSSIADRLAFIVQPTNATVGNTITPAVQVEIRDQFGNRVSGATNSVTLVLTNPGGATLSGGGPIPAVNGVATFSNLSINQVGTGYNLSASASGLAGATSSAFNITSGAVSSSQSTVVAVPTSITAGSGTSTITVNARDAGGNPVSGATVVLSATGSGNTITQPAGLTGANGVATGSLSSTVAGTKTVTATANGVTLTQQPTVTVTAPGGSFVMVGAGDIADCSEWHDDSTGALVDRIPGEVFTLGDNAYPNGTTSEFNNCYDPAWGSFKARTHPSVGNRDYNTSGATPYYNYFGAAAGVAGQGYYSFDVGAWHVVVLNSNIATGIGSPQQVWLSADLAAHPNLCTLAYWHHPLYSSTAGAGTTENVARPFWDALYAAGADVVLNGHRHSYERIARLRPDGTLDPVGGIRTFVVGTGGVGPGSFTNIVTGSEVREGQTFGVMKLTLSASSYTWEFVPITGQTFTDTGTETCH